MKHLLAVLFASVVLMSGAARACDQEEHQEHHAQGAAAQGAAQTSMTKMDEQMKMMREMHEKMMSANSAEERSAMMAGHMKAMQEGMAMLDDMRATAGRKMKGKLPPAAMLEQHKKMEKRMEMMQAMMQMMMDCMPAFGK